jgi:MoaA/NifB/PqqE/SkfB family radical SAM enzyme
MKKMRAYFNVGRLRLNMALKRTVIDNYPVKAYIEPTLFCNLRCPACPTGLQLGLRPSTTVDLNFFKKAIDEVGDYVFDLLMYNRGEPLLHKQTPEMIRYAKAKGIKVRVSTNLSLKLSDDYIERLVRSGLDDLIVSLDGTTPETYSHYRRLGEFDLVCRNMRHIQATKERLGTVMPNIIWQFLVFKHNEHEIEQAMAEYKDWGADTLFLSGADMPPPPHDKGFAPSIIPQYNEYHSEHPNQTTIKNYIESGKPCSWLYGVFVLNPNGKVSPCCYAIREEDDFAEYTTTSGFFVAWNSSRFSRARRLVIGRKRPPPKASEAAPAQPGIKGPKVKVGRRRTSLPVIDSRMQQPASSHSDKVLKGQPRTEPEQLICHKCPIVKKQNEALIVITQVAHRTMEEFRQSPSLKVKGRALLGYLLMGAPNFREVVGAPMLASISQWRASGRMYIHNLSLRTPRLRGAALRLLRRRSN